MAASLNVEIISPTRVLHKFEAKAVTVPGAMGYLTILPGHTPLITEIGVGELRAVDAEGKTYEYFVSGGYAECDNTHVQILAEVIEKAQEVNLERATKARERAADRLKDAKNDLARAQAALRRADSRITFANKHRGAELH